jgi:nitrite reductase/ring-hydroxylating ferredoxin subunit
MVISRGLVGDLQGTPFVASPIYKQRFRLRDGGCIDDPAVTLTTYPVKVVDGVVSLQFAG